MDAKQDFELVAVSLTDYEFASGQWWASGSN